MSVMYAHLKMFRVCTIVLVLCKVRRTFTALVDTRASLSVSVYKRESSRIFALSKKSSS